MRRATRRAPGIGCTLLLILAGLVWWHWFPRPREPSYGRLYVAEFGNDRIQVFDLDGDSLATLGSSGRDPASFDAPGGIAVDDFYNHRVQKFRSDGTFLTAFGGADELDRPTDVAVAADGAVYVVDLGNHRIQVYAPGNERVRR